MSSDLISHITLWLIFNFYSYVCASFLWRIWRRNVMLSDFPWNKFLDTFLFLFWPDTCNLGTWVRILISPIFSESSSPVFRLWPQCHNFEICIWFLFYSQFDVWSLWRPQVVELILLETVSLNRLHFFRCILYVLFTLFFKLKFLENNALPWKEIL